MRDTARFAPSGDQSASFTFSRISRGAPPDSGTRASVPAVPLVVGAQQNRHFAGRADGKNAAFRQIQRPVLAAARAHRKDVGRFAGPLRAEHHGLAVGRKLRRWNLAAPVRQPLEGRLRGLQNSPTAVDSAGQRDQRSARATAKLENFAAAGSAASGAFAPRPACPIPAPPAHLPARP